MLSYSWITICSLGLEILQSRKVNSPQNNQEIEIIQMNFWTWECLFRATFIYLNPSLALLPFCVVLYQGYFHPWCFLSVYNLERTAKAISEVWLRLADVATLNGIHMELTTRGYLFQMQNCKRTHWEALQKQLFMTKCNSKVHLQLVMSFLAQLFSLDYL